MSVYVDQLCPCLKSAKWPYSESCHLIADTVNELRIFAEKIGLKQNWLQMNTMPHFDLTHSKRVEAIKEGSKEISSAEFVQILKKYREDKQKIKQITKQTNNS